MGRAKLLPDDPNQLLFISRPGRQVSQAALTLIFSVEK